MRNSVLVASDLSEASDRILVAAARMARAAGGELHVVSAYKPPVRSLDGDSAGEIPPAVLEEVQQALPAQLRRVLPPDARVDSHDVRFGKPAEVILERAVEVDASLIVLGAHRGRDVHAKFLGTTADEVVRRARSPCLVLRGNLNIPVNRVGIATDFSPIAEHALDAALEWAAWLGGEDRAETGLCLVHVAPRGDDQAADAARAELDRVARHAAERIPPALALTTETLVDFDASTALAQWAERSSIELLVIGSRGKTQSERSTLGSVSSSLARSARCPVLLIPGP